MVRTAHRRCDRRDAYTAEPVNEKDNTEILPAEHAHLIDRFLALLSVALFCFPPLGLMFGVGAIISS
jgi:hypothetical protein